MKKIVLFIFAFCFTIYAREAIIKDIINENTIIIEQNGIEKRAKLAGIISFLKANQKNRDVSYKKRENLQSKAIDFLKENLRVGEKIDFIKIDYENDKSLHIWASYKDGREINYQMIKDGYALLDANDPYLLGSFYMRLYRAQKYAKDKRFGLWKNEFKNMKKLAEVRDFYGSSNKNVKKIDILEYFKQKAMKKY
ncbi:thermonuclease family protein [Nitrosophilus kaiyonis]|uniref:thermonuclease family protein n=1 Tax=Nitrosophilus kaiyonis TaxID=2930200 RepID=UPI0024904107|nr:thermonuclease family protein [Nitrosophilus kaiyonis]